MSFAIRQQPRRHTIRVVTGLLAAPIVAILVLGIVIKFVFFKEPPTLAELSREFSIRRIDLEEILRMSDEDVRFSRIAPTFVDRVPDEPNELGRFNEGDLRAGLPKARWDAYRKIYARNGITLGIQRDGSGDAFIMVDSVGLLNRGHATGYLHCAASSSTDGNRFHPCLLRQGSGKQDYDPAAGKEAYSFEKLDDRWFVYDEGPS